MTDIFVSNTAVNNIPAGNDTTGDGTKASPYLTFVKAWASKADGDTIYLNDGSYTSPTQAVSTVFVGVEGVTPYKATLTLGSGLQGFNVQGSSSQARAVHIGRINIIPAATVAYITHVGQSTGGALCSVKSGARYILTTAKDNVVLINDGAVDLDVEVYDGGICSSDGSLLDLGSTKLGRVIQHKGSHPATGRATYSVKKFLFNVRAQITNNVGPLYFLFLNQVATSSVSVSGVHGSIINTNTGNSACFVIKYAGCPSGSSITNNKGLYVENESENCFFSPLVIAANNAARPTHNAVIANNKVVIKSNHGFAFVMGEESSDSYMDNSASYGNDIRFISFGSVTPTSHGASTVNIPTGGGVRYGNKITGAKIGSLTKNSNATSYGNVYRESLGVSLYAKGSTAGAKFIDETVYPVNGFVNSIELALKDGSTGCDNVTFSGTKVLAENSIVMGDSLAGAFTVIGSSVDASTGSSKHMQISSLVSLVASGSSKFGKYLGLEYADIDLWNASPADPMVSVGGSATAALSLSGVAAIKTANTYTLQDANGFEVAKGKVDIAADGTASISAPNVTQDLVYTVVNSDGTQGGIGKVSVTKV